MSRVIGVGPPSKQKASDERPKERLRPTSELIDALFSSRLSRYISVI
jgi:hypothetical protein